jgi:hypothetical protein
MEVKLSEWENWDKLTDDTALFILDQAEKKLSELISAADALTNRAINTLQFSIPGLALLIGFIYSDYSSGILGHLSIIAIIVLVAISILAFMTYHLYKVVPLGNTPINLINDEKVLHEKQKLVFLFNAIKTAQNSIDKNELANKKRVKNIKRIQIIIWFGLTTELILYPLIYYLVILP